jgi:hypothetical protein
MADTEKETEWRAEFERFGHDAIHREHRMFDEPKRQFAFRWLREKEFEDEQRAVSAHWYSKWTFVAAVAAVIVGVVGVLVTVFGH